MALHYDLDEKIASHCTTTTLHTAHSQWSERYGQYLKHIAGNVLPRHFGQLGDDDYVNTKQWL